MPTTTLDRDIRDRIDSFLTELSGLVKKAALEAVRGALGEGDAPRRRRRPRGPGRPRGVRRRGPGRPRGATRRGPGRPRKPAARRGRPARAGKRVRRSAEDLAKITARVLTHVKANAGHRLEQIGAALKTDTAILKRPIAKLLEAKKLRTEGRKRGTMYFAGGRRGGARKASAGTRRRAKRARRVSRKRATRRTATASAPTAPAAA